MIRHGQNGLPAGTATVNNGENEGQDMSEHSIFCKAELCAKNRPEQSAFGFLKCKGPKDLL